MYASIFNARKTTGFKFELVVHSQPGINGESVQAQHYFNSKVEAKQFAKSNGLKAWNY
jgi:hypothetical protein